MTDELHRFDYVIVGSGAGAVAAALVVKRNGKRPLIIESTDRFGGSTSLSGGLAWIPDNHILREKGIEDSFEQAWVYLEACSAGAGIAASPERRRAFLEQAPRVMEFLEGHGMKWHHSEGYSDYHEGEYPGAIARGRAMEGKPFDLRRLGPWEPLLRQHIGDQPISAPEMGKLSLVHSGASYLVMAKVGWRMLLNKLGRKIRCRGNAIQGRLLEIALRNEIEIWLNSPLVDLVFDEGRVCALKVARDGKVVTVDTSDGVLLNGGGFAHNLEMRALYQPALGTTEYSAANPGDMGEVIEIARKAGAATDLMDLSWWVPSSIVGPGIFAFHVPNDSAKPHCMIVDGKGERFVCEATSYVSVGMAMLDHARAEPDFGSWFIVDSQFRRKYRWGAGVFPAGDPPEEWITSGYMIRAETIEQLGQACGIDPERLASSIARFNSFCRSGVDEDFAKGSSAYHRFFGDPRQRGNACLGELSEPPYYAVRLVPSDVGTAGGLATDEKARVLTEDGKTIPGLYATGNATAPVVGRSYPGAGASISAAMTFGYIAAHHATGRPASLAARTLHHEAVHAG